MKKVVVVCGALALIAQAAFAQSGSSQGSQGGSSELSSQQQSGQSVSHMRLSKFIGSNAKSKDGQNMGQVEDIMIDPKTGKITFALLSKGGVAGIGEKHMPVPWQAINVKSERDFMVNVDRQKMQSAQTTDADKSADLNNPDYVLRIYRFYTVEPPSGVGAPGSGMEEGQGSQEEQGSSEE